MQPAKEACLQNLPCFKNILTMKLIENIIMVLKRYGHVMKGIANWYILPCDKASSVVNTTKIEVDHISLGVFPYQ